MLEPTLKAAGLDPKETLVYEEILKNGKLSAAPILEILPIKRGDLYNILHRLERKKLIHQLPGVKKLTYSIRTPEMIEEAIRDNEKNLTEAKKQLSLLYSLFNLGMGRPGVRFAQGVEGIKEIFNETLTSKTEILSYADVDGWIKYLGNYAKWYAKERLEKGVKERVIAPDTPGAKKYLSDYDMSVTKVKFIPYLKFKFSMEMNIYDNKILYVTLREPFMAVLIENQAIADTQRAIFELSWSFRQ